MAIKPSASVNRQTESEADRMVAMLKSLVGAWVRGNHAGQGETAATPSDEGDDNGGDTETDTPSQDSEDLDDPSLNDQRFRSRKVYYLAPNALQKMDKIPARPSACRKVFRYLSKFDAGTVKAISKELILEKKTVGNALAALKSVKLIQSTDLPKVG